MTDLRTISPEELPAISEIPDDLYAVVFSPTGPLQAVPHDRLLSKLVAANLSKATRAALEADLSHPADSVALVFSDPVAANNGWYRKTGAAGTGSWSQFEELARNSRLLADQARAASEAAADVATEQAGLLTDYVEQFAGPAYATLAEGEAATTAGQFFRVSNGDTPRTFTRYQRTAGGSVVVAPLATTTALSAATGAELVGFVAAAAGAVERHLLDKVRDIVSLTDFGSVSAADGLPGAKFVPEGVYDTALAAGTIQGRYWGQGQIRDAAGRKRGPWYSHVSARPVGANIADHDWIETAFQRDWSKCQIAMEHRVTGLATLGQPASGYLYTPEAMPIYIRLRNESGWNQATAGNGGRTGIAGIRVHVDQLGQGDAACFNGTAFVTGRRAGSTDFLADPAGVIFNGDISLGGDACYANMGEFAMNDGGFAGAAIGWVVNGYRTNPASVRGSFWAGYRAQSQGAHAMDQGYGLQGLFKVGFDSVTADCQRPIALKSGQRIALNDFSTNGRWANGANGDYIFHDAGISGINCVVFGASIFQMANGASGGQVSVVGVPFAANNNVILSGLGQYANDAAAAAGGVPLSGIYRDSNNLLRWRAA